MNFLLDTHVFIWSINEVDKLSSIVRDSLEDADNNIYVSSVTYWEIALKYSLGKLNIEGFSPQDLPALATKMGFKSISLSPAESSASHLLEPVFHKDPFDKMLIWQAISQDFILISKDDNVSKYNSAGLKVLW